MKRVLPRPTADLDIDEAVFYLYNRESKKVATSFLVDVAAAFERLGQMPGIGSARFSQELNIPSLRTLSLRRFPYLIFYREHEDFIDVVRVLHAHRDISGVLLRLQ